MEPSACDRRAVVAIPHPLLPELQPGALGCTFYEVRASGGWRVHSGRQGDALRCINCQHRRLALRAEDHHDRQVHSAEAAEFLADGACRRLRGPAGLEPRDGGGHIRPFAELSLQLRLRSSLLGNVLAQDGGPHVGPKLVLKQGGAD